MTSSPSVISSGRSILARIRVVDDPQTLVWTLVVLGALLRIVQYAANRPLWLDEALLSLNVADKSFGELLGILNFQQGAPPGFLFAEKLSTVAFGVSEYSLRLFPLLCGLASLPIFARLARQLLAPVAAVAALAGFALLNPLIYYSSEAKQYSTDVLVALLIWSASAAFLARRSRLEFARLTLVGALGIWFSHAALLVLPGVATVLVVVLARERASSELRRLAASFGLWLISLSAVYALTLRHLRDLQENVVGGASPYSMPFPPTSSEDIEWFVEQGHVIFQTMIGWSTPAALVAGSLFVLGAAIQLRHHRAQGALLLLPLVSALAASGLDLYPFGRRYVLFLFPLIPLFVAEATLWLIGQTARARLPAVVPAIILVILLGLQAERAARELRNPVRREDISPVLRHIDRNWQEGDRLYLYYAAQYAFRFYAERAEEPKRWPIVYAPDHPDQFAPALVSQPPSLVVGSYSRGNPELYFHDLRQLRGAPRVWILFSHVVAREDELMLGYLDRLGKQLTRLKTNGAAAYLYDLRSRNS